MEIDRITSKGQITIPIAIRRSLGVREGDKILFIERDGGVLVINSAVAALRQAQKAFEGEAARIGLENEEDAMRMMRDFRQERYEEDHGFLENLADEMNC